MRFPIKPKDDPQDIARQALLVAGTYRPCGRVSSGGPADARIWTPGTSRRCSRST
jgi:hypothetical protein